MVCVVFIAMMVEVTISLIILSAKSHEGSLLSLLVWLKGSIWSRLAGCLHTFLVTIPSLFVVMGLLHLNHLVSLRIVSPGYGFAHAIDGFKVGYDGYYAKGLA
jgi:hypothetical protein